MYNECVQMNAKTRMIAIIEDEPETAEMFAEMMRVGGYRVIVSEGGSKAIPLIRVARPEAIILDLMLPDFSGLQILEHLQEDPELARIPVIIVSALSLPGDIELGLKAGAVAYLTKPVSFIELKEAVDKVIDAQA